MIFANFLNFLRYKKVFLYETKEKRNFGSIQIFVG